MVFPTSLETGVGVAGPTADIGHAAAHSSSGTAATLERIQTTIGLNTETQSYTPTWKGTAPSTNLVRWNRVGNIIAVSYEFRWTIGYGFLDGGASIWTGSFPWGSFHNSWLFGTGKFVVGATTSAGALQLRDSGAYGRIACYRSTQSTNSFNLIGSASDGSYFEGSGILVAT